MSVLQYIEIFKGDSLPRKVIGHGVFHPFRTSMDRSGLEVLPDGYRLAEDAITAAQEWVRDYKQATFPCGAAELCAILHRPDGLHYPIVNSYFSNS